MKEAIYYIKSDHEITRCLLCPHNCVITNGNRGICGVRLNQDGVLFSEVYGKPVSVHLDPIEKKPLYHFYPGYNVLSIGTVGCNLKCSFCQNCEISQVNGDSQAHINEMSVKELIGYTAGKPNNIGIAFTYNEPVIFFEYMVDIAKEIHISGLKNIMVSNGYINPEPLDKLLDLIDAFNIDLKSFSNEFYKRYTKSTLNPVLQTIKTIHNSGKHLELTFLAIPGINDELPIFSEMVDWILHSTGPKTVLHISRYFPHFKMELSPTPLPTLLALYESATEKLDYVYLGNTTGETGRDTICPNCKNVLIRRNGYKTIYEGLDPQGNCKNCKSEILKNVKN